jgi:hypothetical protein
VRAALLTVLLLLSAPAAAETVDVRCPAGFRFMGNLKWCPCCEICPDGTWVVEGEGSCTPPPAESVVEPPAPEKRESAAWRFFRAFVATAAVLLGYFLPSLIAGTRRHPHGNAIFLVNLLLGWTLLGWLAALIWSAVRRDGGLTR